MQGSAQQRRIPGNRL